MTLEELAEDIVRRRQGEVLARRDYAYELRQRGMREDDAARLADLCDSILDATESTQSFRSH